MDFVVCVRIKSGTLYLKHETKDKISWNFVRNIWYSLFTKLVGITREKVRSCLIQIRNWTILNKLLRNQLYCTSVLKGDAYMHHWNSSGNGNGQAIITWTNDDLLLIEYYGTNFIDTYILRIFIHKCCRKCRLQNGGHFVRCIKTAVCWFVRSLQMGSVLWFNSLSLEFGRELWQQHRSDLLSGTGTSWERNSLLPPNRDQSRL